MKTGWFCGFFMLVCMGSCNEDPDICLEMKLIPVVYSVFNKYDSVNFIYITKSWSGDNGGTVVTAKNLDSIYFRDVDVQVDLIRNAPVGNPSGRKVLHITPSFEWIHDKKPGMFAFPDCPLYVLSQNLMEYDSSVTYINIPGYRTIDIRFYLQWKPEINFPHKDGMLLAIYPDKGLIIDFDGGSVNEVRFQFQVITKTGSGFTTDTVEIRKYMNSGRTTFTYDYLRAGLLQQLTFRTDIEYRKLGKAGIVIWSGFGSFPMLPVRQEFNSYNNDYMLPGSPKIPSLFFFGGTIGTNSVKNLELDYWTNDAIANDTALARFRFLKW